MGCFVLFMIVLLLCVCCGQCKGVDTQLLALSKPVKAVSLTLSGGGGGALNRPIQPSRDLPILDLIESPDKMYDPKLEDLDPQFLLEKLGKNFDSRFMSARRPLDAVLTPNATADIGYERNRNGQWLPRGKMPSEIKRLKFKSWSATGSRSKLSGSRLSPKLRRRMRQFLWTYTYCPVVHVWKDLGIRFWPRWLREGHCYSRHSCSFPRGMSCKPNRSENKTVLRWHCQDWDKSSYCKWIPIKYPVVVQCTCSC